MNQTQPLGTGTTSQSQDAAGPLIDAGDTLADTVTSKAPAASLAEGPITEGMPVMDCRGETIGNVAAYDEAQGVLVVRGGWLFAQDTAVPLDAIGDRGASGLYLKPSKDELAQQYGSEPMGSPGTPAGPMPTTRTEQQAAAPQAATETARSFADSGVPPTPLDKERSTMAPPEAGAMRPAPSGAAETPGATEQPTATTSSSAAGAPLLGASAEPSLDRARGAPAPDGRAGLQTRPLQTLTTYLGDVHALESHILQALDTQVRLLHDHPAIRAQMRVYRNTLENHRDALEARQRALGGSPTHPVKEAVAAALGVAAGLYAKVRSEEASKNLRDDYTAFNHALIAYVMLHTTALALSDQETADLCARHMEDHARFVMEINQEMPALVLAELRQDRLPVAEAALSTAQETVHRMWQQPPHTA